ncbi:MAG: biotin--[acetyl-CoA-carboxylase] ligase, partial [Gemmiger sp.]|nr:biotin--[acetyl-CoA-carboxylase] ligase [Gemmiger sp.]
MRVKEAVLGLLGEGQGQYLSGEGLAARLGVTRASVWKAIKALQSEGYPIEAVTNRGYRLTPDYDLLSAAGVATLLEGPAAVLRPEALPTVDSTNAHLRTRAQNGEGEGLVLLAGEQTAGRGRAGRAFHSPAGTGLYLSILLRPALPAADAPLLTLAAAVAAAQAVEEVCNVPVEIKWVNDLLLGGKKICGILTEAALSLESGGVDYAVLGVGINLAPPAGGWPEALGSLAGAVYPAAAAIPPGCRCRLAAAFLNAFWGYDLALPGRGFLPGYRRRLAWP